MIAAPISTGDTALRSARLTLADWFHFDQKPIWKRLVMTAPLLAMVVLFMSIDFNILWRYFAWSNQTLAAFTLWAVAVYLIKSRSIYWVALLPTMFMTAVCVTYLLFAPRPEGFGLGIAVATGAGVAVAGICAAIFFHFKSVYNRKMMESADV